MKDDVTAFAPATVANVAVGFDILGFAVEGVGDRVRVRRAAAGVPSSLLRGSPLRIAEISGVETRFPTEPHRNTATVGLLELWKDLHLDFSAEIFIEKGIPTQSGMGGSAASAVAGLVAVNSLLVNLGILKEPLSTSKLFEYALLGEKLASGAPHPDNVGPCLFGGITLIRDPARLKITSIPVPTGIRCVLVHPHLLLSTKAAREVLTPTVLLETHVRQSAALGGLLAGCFQDDLSLIRESLKDFLIEPQRETLIPGFKSVQKAALDGGALGCSISGSGPSVFAWVEEKSAKAIGEAMVGAFRKHSIQADLWISDINRSGAYVI